jgi:hypothetical protein
LRRARAPSDRLLNRTGFTQRIHTAGKDSWDRISVRRDSTGEDARIFTDSCSVERV